MSNSTERFDDPLPPMRLILPLQRGDAPIVDGLEQTLAEMINAFDAQAAERQAFVPPATEDEEWVPATEKSPSLAKVESQLYHAIDEQATMNPDAVAAHQAASPSAQETAIVKADARLKAAVERLRESGVALSAEIFELAEVE